MTLASRRRGALRSLLRPGERRLVALALIVGCAAIAMAFVAVVRRSADAVARDGGTYVEGIVGRIPELDPLTCRDTPATADACALVFAGLTKQNPETNETVGALARTWAISNGNRTYTVTLREDARFHDGSVVTADDVLFTYKTILQDPAFPGTLKAAFKGVAITSSDPQTISFTLQKENAFFPESLSIGILPKKSLDGIAAAALTSHPFFQKPLGAGPFRVVDLKHGDDQDVLDLTPIDPATHIKTLRLVAYKDTTTLLDRLASLDGVKEAVPPFDPHTSPGWRQIDLHVPRYVGLFFNTERASMQSPKVRQALALAVPRAAIIETIEGAVPVWAPISVLERQGAVTLSAEQQKSASKRAGELLVEAGWRISTGASGSYLVKDGKKLVVNLATSGDPDFLTTSKLIRNAWSEIGVEVTLVTPPTLDDLERGIVQTGNYDALLVGISTGSDLDLYPQFHSSQSGEGANFSRYKDLDADLLMEKIRKTPNAEAQLKLAASLIDLLQRDAPAVFIYSPAHPYALRTSVEDVVVPHRLTTVAGRFALFRDWSVRRAYVWK